MKCKQCGAEIGNGSKCEFCGSSISIEMKKEKEEINKQGCIKCHSSNITFSREKYEDVDMEKRLVHNYRTVGLCKDCGFSWNVEAEIEKRKKSKGKTILWILAWLFMFPIPIMIILKKAKLMPDSMRWILVCVAWFLYYCLLVMSK